MNKLWLVFCLMMVSVLVYAGGKKAQAGNPEASEELKLYLQGDPASPQSAGDNAALAAFSSQNPQIKLNIEYGSGEAFHQKFQAVAASGDMPDGFTTYVGKRSAYITETGQVLDLRPYLDDSFRSQFVSGTWQQQSPDGAIYTVPPSLAVTHAMFANAAILAELGLEFPTTYQDLLAQVPVIRAAGYYPVSLGNKDLWPMNSWLLSVLVHRLGGTEWFDRAMRGDAAFNERPFVRALEVIREMSAAKVFSPGVNQLSNTEADQEFFQKKSVYLIDAAWRVSAMVNILSPADQQQVVIGVFPALRGEVSPNSSTAVPSEGFGISAALKGRAKAEAMWELIRFFTGEEGAAIRLQHGIIPSYKMTSLPPELPEIQVRALQFTNETSYGYVIDAKMDPAGMTDLNQNLQSMMFGNISPQEVANQYEAWVAANDSNRGN